MSSNSYSLTQISTGSQIKLTAKLAARIDKRQHALQREREREREREGEWMYAKSPPHPFRILFNTPAHTDRIKSWRGETPIQTK